MEKTLTIDGKLVRLSSNASTPLRYKMQFKKDYFAELLKLAKVFDVNSEEAEATGADEKEQKETEELDLSQIAYDDLDHLDFEVLYNFVWILAKTADKTIPAPLEWLDTFDEFPIVEIFPEVTGLLQSSLKTKKK